MEPLLSQIGRQSWRRTSTQARSFFLKSRRTFQSTSKRHVAPQPLDSPEVKSAEAYCSDLLRKYDSPSYTLSHFVRPHILPAYLAIRAFNIELARIPDVVSNVTIGTMRMQFWKQTIDSTFDGKPPAEPVAVLLASWLSKNSHVKLNKVWFHRIINARDQQFANPGFTNITGVESYAESTYSTLLYLTLSALQLKSITMDHLASHVGKAAGIATVLRGVPLLAFPAPSKSHSVNPAGMGLPPTRTKQGTITLPLDVMSRCGVREDDILKNGANAEGIRDAVFEVATRASDHLITARSMLKNIKNFEDPDHEFEHASDVGHEYTKYDENFRQSGEKRKQELDRGFGVVMGPAVSTQLFLDRLQKVDFDIFNDSLRRTEWKLPAVAWWKSKKEEF